MRPLASQGTVRGLGFASKALPAHAWILNWLPLLQCPSLKNLFISWFVGDFKWTRLCPSLDLVAVFLPQCLPVMESERAMNMQGDEHRTASLEMLMEVARTGWQYPSFGVFKFTYYTKPLYCTKASVCFSGVYYDIVIVRLTDWLTLVLGVYKTCCWLNTELLHFWHVVAVQLLRM